jgi:hypothetical protein
MKRAVLNLIIVTVVAMIVSGAGMAETPNGPPVVFEFSEGQGDLPSQWLLHHGPLPAGAQIALRLEDGTWFSGVQFFGVIGSVGPGVHQIIAENDAITSNTPIKVIPYIWTPGGGMRAAVEGEILSLEPIHP